MELTKEQQEIYDGKKGEVLSKVMKSLVLYGENFGATKMVPVTSKYGHIVTSFGVIVIKGVFELMDQLINAGLKSKQLFTADPRPIDPHVPANLLQKIVFKVMYGEQKRYERQLSELGLLSKNSFSCASYLKEVGNTPKEGEILSWAESSAVNYVNSVLGARCNRNSGIMELFGSILGFVPYFGLLTDEGRKADWIIEVKTSKLPEPQLLGSAIGMKVVEDVPYVKGLDKYLNPKMDDDTVIYLKDFGAAAASNGAVGLYHIDGITPEAKKLKTKLIKPNAKTYVITDEELERVKNNYPVIWKDVNAKPKLCFIGCPHMNLKQLTDWTNKIEAKLKENNRKKVSIKTVFTAPVPVIEMFNKTPEGQKIKKMGITLSYICPLMYMSNPLCAHVPVITNSNKLRTYTSARYYTNDEILNKITSEVK